MAVCQAIGTGGMRFSEHLARRLQLWWGVPRQWNEWRTYRDGLHRLGERHRFRHRTDPDSTWRCCEFWQRTLINKWNSREFAAKHGCTVPTLYWWGHLPPSRVLVSMPEQFVVRPVWGAARQGTHVVAAGRDLLWGKKFTPAQLRTRMLRSAAAWSVPVLLEEFVCAEDGQSRLPTEYKCHTFGDVVAAIEVLTRQDHEPDSAVVRYYTPAWEPFADPMDLACPLGPLTPPPRCLQAILHAATTLGTAVGTYMRVDFFAPDCGCIFNEFSSTPNKGKMFTPYADEFFGTFWDEKFPESI